MLISIISQTFFAFLASLSFAFLFNVSKKDIIFCGFTGSVGWFFYELIILGYNENAKVLATFVATLIVVFVSRRLSFTRKAPLTIFMISGIISFVPGAGIYYTMLNTINGKNIEALTYGVQTFKIAGVISISILIVLSLPPSFFSFKKII